MRKTKQVIAAACMAAVPVVAPAQMSVSLAPVGPNTVARWGSGVTLLATVTGACSTNPTTAGVATFIVQGPAPVTVSQLTSNAALACNAGTFSWPFQFAPAWLEMGVDWQTFRSTAYTTLGPQGSSKVLSMRFDPEFVGSFGSLPYSATLATQAGGFNSCDGHAFSLTDRETMNVPPPPPNFRTPYEMFHVTTSRCAGSAPNLLNMTLPTGFGGTLIYDRFMSSGAWRVAGASYCGPSIPGPPPPCFSDVNYRQFDRGANMALYGDAAGVQAVVAFWSPQADVRETDLQDLWWAGPAESGWGLHIAKSGENLFVSGFIYDDAGRPMWVYMPQGQWDPQTHVWYGNLYSPMGARYGAYSPSLLTVGAAVGTGSLSFSNADTGHFDYTINKASGGKSISRFEFGARGDKPGKYTGMWWGLVEESGWGVAVSHQGDTVFATWYTYDDEFRTTWFFMPEGKLTPAGSYAGALYKATGAPWAGRHYSADSTKVIAVGTLDLKFGEDKPGVMTAVVNGEEIVNPLARFPF